MKKNNGRIEYMVEFDFRDTELHGRCAFQIRFFHTKEEALEFLATTKDGVYGEMRLVKF